MTRHSWIRITALTALVAAGALRCGDSNQPPAATTIEMAGGDDQSGTVGQPLANPLVVLVTDDNGNPVDGVSVGWAAQGGGSVSAETTETGSDGQTSVGRVLGPQPGEQTTTATVSGLQGSPVTFVATASDGSTPMLAMKTQPASAAQSGVPLTTQPVVQLQDAAGNDQAQSGVEVTASLVGTTGTLGGTLARSTDGTGAAAFTDLAITGPAGSYTLRFTAPGTLPVSSSSIAIAGGTRHHRDHDQPTGLGAQRGGVRPPRPTGRPGDGRWRESGAWRPGHGEQGFRQRHARGQHHRHDRCRGRRTVRRPRYQRLRVTHPQFTAGAASVTSSPVTISPLPPRRPLGKWGPVVTWDIVPLHLNLLPNGKILAWGKRDAPTSARHHGHAAHLGSGRRPPESAYHRSRWTACSSVPATPHAGRPTHGRRWPPPGRPRDRDHLLLLPGWQLGKAVPTWRTPGGTRPSPRCRTGACSRWAVGTRTETW